jgi:uncharacterized protein with NRDE domain
VALHPGSPRLLAGRDEDFGGTWLAVNENGVVAGLTNQPTRAGRDPSKRSRGELPLFLAAHLSATSALDALLDEVDPESYNPCSMLLGDRSALYSVELEAGTPFAVRELGEGNYVLENRPFIEQTPKTRHVARRLATIDLDGDDEALRHGLYELLADHTLPEGLDAARTKFLAASAACVHTPDYGTRSAAVVLVGSGPDDAPRMFAVDEAPCTGEFHEVAWS